MNRSLMSIAAATLALVMAGQAQAHDEKCDPIPKEEWKPQADLERKLTNEGWKISRVKITNGCYEVYGRDAKNNKMETFFHPKTFEIVTAPKHPYTQALLAAVPRTDRAPGEKRPRLAGEPPSSLSPPAGCAFHTRCPHAMPVCRETSPMPRRAADGHQVSCHLIEEV